MERQRLSERGPTVEPDRIRSLYNRADLSKRPHHGDELLGVVCRIVADEGEGRNQAELLELWGKGLSVADRVGSSVPLSPLDCLRTRGSDHNVVDPENLGVKEGER